MVAKGISTAEVEPDSRKRAANPARGSKPGERRGGRQKGTPNRLTGQLKDMILTALDQAHPEGGVEYLKVQATLNSSAFLALVGKVLPMTIAGDPNAPLKVVRVELVGE